MLFVVEGNFTRPVEKGPEFAALLQGHIDFIQKYIDAGMVLFAAPKPTGGGYFVIKAPSLEQAQETFREDPFLSSGLNRYTYTQFLTPDCAPCVKDWFAE